MVDSHDVSLNKSFANYLISSHPRLGQLMEYNARGTLQLMHDYNAVIIDKEPGKKAIHVFQIKLPKTKRHVVDDDCKTWADFKEEIEKFITKICKENLLNSYNEQVFNNAIKVLSDHFWGKYFEKFPTWPSCKGAENKGNIKICFTHLYSYEGQTIIWNCDGDILVGVTRVNEAYRSYLCGSPEIQVILIKNSLLDALETTMNVPNLDQAKTKVDDKLKKLNWDEVKLIQKTQW